MVAKTTAAREAQLTQNAVPTQDSTQDNAEQNEKEVPQDTEKDTVQDSEKRSAGVGILLSDRGSLNVLDVRRDTEGRVLSLLVKWVNVRYAFVCVYAPVDVSDRKVLSNFVFPNSYCVIGGNFNCVLNDRDSTARSGANKAGGEEWVVFGGLQFV